jgi:GxxExxY protein
MSKYINKEETEKIIKCAYQVHNELGCGFLEKVYKNALIIALREIGLTVEEEVPIKVCFHRQCVGEYFADILVQGSIILEIKAVECLIDIHEIQLKNYLRATGIELGLLINFGESVEVKRKFVSNSNSLSS